MRLRFADAQACQQIVRYNFDWDPEKAKGNLAKHRVAFESAATVFLDANAVSVYDEDHSGHEDRWITMGFDGSGALLVVHHTFQNVDESTCAIRVILGPQGYED